MSERMHIGGGRVIQFTGRHRCFSGEIGGCTVQVHEVNAYEGSHAAYIKPQSYVTPIAHILDAAGVLVPESRSGGMILFAYLNVTEDETGKYHKGETLNGIPFEIRPNKLAKAADWKFYIFCTDVTPEAEEFFKVCGVAGYMEFKAIRNMDEIREKTGIKKDKAA